MPAVLSQDLVDQLVSTFVYTDSELLTDLKHFTYNLIKNLDKPKLLHNWLLHKYIIDDNIPLIFINKLGYEREPIDICGVKVSVIMKMPAMKNEFGHSVQGMSTSQNNFSCSLIVGVGSTLFRMEMETKRL
ncbi:Hypothetical_protein [Hexamita inflata]|uniref:Hypothetical_protein n=1 Tax=Hexamita inflata TaxID=28002 RepID=A0AA86R7H6_9EUKA|nr:Hypothetical protein HINF_LOCUS55119 [Hexamita inflata]